MFRKNVRFVAIRWHCVLSSSKYTKTRFRPGSAPNPASAGELRSAGEGNTPSHPSTSSRRLRRLHLGAPPLSAHNTNS